MSIAVGLAVVVSCVGCAGKQPEPDATTATTTAAAPLAASTNTAPTNTAPTNTAPTNTSTSTTSTSTTTTTITTSTSTVPQPTTTPYGLPIADADRAGWGETHSNYPATDVFVGCGAELVSPVNGTALEVRRVNTYDPAVDNPATRGGRSIAILGDDGVRYYLAHLATIVAPLLPGDRVTVGEVLGTMGDTGRASACHVHFSISPPCPGSEWSVRRGVIWPYPYLNAWRNGEQLSPVDEVIDWLAANPLACEQAMAAPNAADA